METRGIKSIVKADSTKTINSVTVSLLKDTNGDYCCSFTDINVQAGQYKTGYNTSNIERYSSYNTEHKFNCILRRDATVIIPNGCMVPYESQGQVLPGDTNLISSHAKVEVTAGIISDVSIGNSQEDLAIEKQIDRSECMLYNGNTGSIHIDGVIDSYERAKSNVMIANANNRIFIGVGSLGKAVATVKFCETER